MGEEFGLSRIERINSLQPILKFWPTRADESRQKLASVNHVKLPCRGKSQRLRDSASTSIANNRTRCIPSDRLATLTYDTNDCVVLQTDGVYTPRINEENAGNLFFPLLDYIAYIMHIFYVPFILRLECWSLERSILFFRRTFVPLGSSQDEITS